MRYRYFCDVPPRASAAIRWRSCPTRRDCPARRAASREQSTPRPPSCCRRRTRRTPAGAHLHALAEIPFAGHRTGTAPSCSPRSAPSRRPGGDRWCSRRAPGRLAVAIRLPGRPTGRMRAHRATVARAGRDTAGRGGGRERRAEPGCRGHAHAPAAGGLRRAAFPVRRAARPERARPGTGPPRGPRRADAARAAPRAFFCTRAIPASAPGSARAHVRAPARRRGGSGHRERQCGPCRPARRQRARGGRRVRLAYRPGVEMGRPSLLEASAIKRGGEVEILRIGGRSVLVCDGWIEAGAEPG